MMNEKAEAESHCMIAEAPRIRASLETLRECNLSCGHNLTWTQLAAVQHLKAQGMTAERIAAALETMR